MRIPHPEVPKIPPPMTSYRREQLHQGIFIGGLAMVAVAMPVSVYFMSVGQLLIAANWFLQGRFAEKLRTFRANKPAMVFSAIYLLYVLGFFYSSDKPEALGNLVDKLPILSLVFFVASSRPVPPGTRKWLLLAFSGSITVLSLIGVGLLLWGEVGDYRELSPFVSHIRVGLMTALSIVSLSWMGAGGFYPGRGRQPETGTDVRKETNRIRGFMAGGGWRLACFVLAGWHLVYLFMLQSLSGIIALLAVLMIIGIRTIVRGNKCWRIISVSALSLLALIIAGLLAWGWTMVNLDHKEDLGQLDSHTAMGNPYQHDTTSTFRENGKLVYLYIAPDELREAWEARSGFDYMGNDLRGQELRYTLFRFLTSKGLRKDAQGLAQLTPGEIEAVEKGIANVNYLHWPGVLIRIHQSFWEISEYRREKKPEGHTLSQRVTFWKAAREAIEKRPWFGWGTGDMLVAMQYGFDRSGSPLAFRSHMKPHNQYLSLLVLFGVVGLSWFVFAVFYAPFRLRGFSHLPFLAFFVILFTSMFIDDTLATQAGLTFFVFFFNVFLFLKEAANTQKP